MIPDVAGFRLSEAREILAENSIRIRGIAVTAPPRLADGVYDESSRILKILPVDEYLVDLIVCMPV